MPRTHDTLLSLSTSLPAQMVNMQRDVLKELPAQLLVMATPEKFAVWTVKCGDASAMDGWGPVHLMPARRMLPSPPRMYRLHSAAPAPATAPAAPAAAAAAAAGPGLLPSGCAEGVMTSSKERMASQKTAAQGPARLQTSSNSTSRTGAV